MYIYIPVECLRIDDIIVMSFSAVYHEKSVFVRRLVYECVHEKFSVYVCLCRV